MTAPDDELSTRAHARIGSVLRGKYRLDRVLGIGGMATVFAATHRNGKEFAVKVLHPELSFRADIRSRFLREGQAANAVKHAGVVTVLDDDVAEDGSAFLVMELLEGETVEELWERSGRRLPLETVLSIGFQLCDVLSAAHTNAIVHRDIKPANLFLSREGHLKVLDFGIARLRDAATSHATTAGMMMGTPAFMAPEQAAGRTTDIDALTDVWAAGATLFTLATGQLVHEADNAQQIIIRAATMPARSLATVLAHAPPIIAQVVDKALAFDKGARWPSAVAMRDAIFDASLATFGRRPSMPSLPDAGDPALLRTLPSEPNAQGLSAPRAWTPAIDEVRAATPRRAEEARALAPLIGATTAKPLSSEVPTMRRPAARKTLPLVAGASAVGVTLVAGIVVVVMMMGKPANAPTVTTASASAPPIATFSASSPATASGTATTTEIPTIAATDLFASDAATPQRNTAAAATPKTTATTTTAATAAAATPTKDCTPYYNDKHIKIHPCK